MQNNNQEQQTQVPEQAKTAGLLGLAFYLAGVPLAGYLSWKCNRNHGFGRGSSSLFALFAGLGSWGYVSNYFWFKSYTCDITYEKCKAAGVIQQ
uniref:Transmembrane protein n=1 Tax=Clandestinovirus TaxID=2831644 RepID=A0A8F8PJT5_9VIRU|nr:transmembrane protein [Clandestinovirus]